MVTVQEPVMRCPKCGSLDTRIIQTYKPAGEDTVYRRRQCKRCRHKFRTQGPRF